MLKLSTEKLKKILKIFATIIVVFITTVFVVFFNLEKVINIASKKFTKSEIVVKEADLLFKGLIFKGLVLEDVKAYDENKNLMIEASKINADFSWDELKIKNIYIDSADINVIRNENGDINLEKAFVKEKTEEEKRKEKEKKKREIEEEERTGKVKKAPIVENIHFSNVNINFKDEGYKNLIEEEIKDINGRFSLLEDRKRELDLKIKNNPENIDLKYAGNSKKYEAKLIANNIFIDENLGQYLDKKGKVQFLNGEVDINLEVSKDKVKDIKNGYINFKNGKIKVEQLKKDIEDINFKADLKNEDVDAVLGFKIAKKSNELKFSINSGKENINIKINIEAPEEKSIIPEIKLNGDIKNNDKEVLIDLKSNISNFKIDYKKDEKEVKVYNNDFNLFYDIKNKKVVSGEGRVDFSLYNLKNYLEFSAKDNLIDIKNLKLTDNKNGEISVNGKADLSTKSLKASYEAKDYYLERQHNGKKIIFDFSGRGNFEKNSEQILSSGEIKKMNLNFIAKVDNLSGKYEIKSKDDISFVGKVKTINYKDYSIKNLLTDLNLKEKKLILNNFSLDKSKITGIYDLKTKKTDVKISLDENLSKYIKNKDLKARATGVANVNGVAGDIKADIDLYIVSSLKGKKLPNVSLKSAYSAKNYSDGILNIKNLSVLANSPKATLTMVGQNNIAKRQAKQSESNITSNRNNKNENELLKLLGTVDLKNKNLDLEIPSKDIDLSVIKNYAEIEALSKINGFINLAGRIKGSFDKFKYDLNLNSSLIAYEDKEIKNFKSSINGDKNNLNLKNISFEFLENLITGTGTYDISQKNYSIDIMANNFKFSTLKNILKSKEIENLTGLGNIKLNLNDGRINGQIATKDINLFLPKQDIKIANLNSNINIVSNNLFIEKFTGKINDGDFKLNGYLKNIDKKKNLEETIKNLKYSLNFELKNFVYKYLDAAYVNLESKLNISDVKTSGDITIKNGQVDSIPNDYESIISIIKNRLNKKKDKNKVEEEKPKVKKDIKKILDTLMPLNIKIKTQNPIKLDVDEFNIVVDDIRGNLDIDLNLRGEKSKYYLEGEAELKDGYITINTNDFYLDRALIVFNKNSYLPKINPNVFIESYVEMDDEELAFDINGQMNRLRYKIISKDGDTSGNLNYLITNSQNEKDLSGLSNNAYTNFFKNLIAGQIARTVFNPVTRKIRKKLDLTKFRVKPEISVYNVDNKYGEPNYSVANREAYSASLNLEVEDNIYKDKLYLKAKTKIFGTSENVVRRNEVEKRGTVKDYDVNLEYRFGEERSKTIGIGVGTVPDKYREEGKKYKDQNYHIDFTIRKRYNSLSEIFSF